MSAEKIDLEELQAEAQKLALLLDAREPGLSVWNEMVLARMQSILSLLLSEDELEVLKMFRANPELMEFFKRNKEMLKGVKKVGAILRVPE